MKFIIIGFALFIVGAISFSSIFITGAIIGHLSGYGDNLFYDYQNPLLILSVFSFLAGFILVFIGFNEKIIFKRQDKKM